MKQGKREDPGDEEIDSDFSSDEETAAAATGKRGRDDDDSDTETADEKRLRLAKQYLQAVRHEEEDKYGQDDADDAVENRLTRDILERTGRYIKRVAGRLHKHIDDGSTTRCLRGHSLTATCIDVAKDDTEVYSGSKDCTVIRWDVETGQKKATLLDPEATKGRQAQVLALSVNSDGRLLAAAGHDSVIRLWDTRSSALVGTFSGHRDSVTGLAFQEGSNQLYSGSSDRSVKVWNMDELAYVDTLYGHQSPILAIDALARERCITSGADRTMRLWKIVEDTQLVFGGHQGNVDCISMLNEDSFITGGEDGMVSLWHTSKKKAALSLSHSQTHVSESGDDSTRWVSAVAACRYSDLAASGAADGAVRLWRAEAPRTLTCVGSVPMAGHVNGLAFSSDGKLLFAACGQEHRLGRWSHIKGVKNGVYITRIGDGLEEGDEDGADDSGESSYEDDSADEVE